MYRYRIPHTFITDNGKQFDNRNFIEFYENLKIDLKFYSLAYPQANGQVEATNKTRKRMLKTKLGEKKGACADEFPGVLWAHIITYKTAAGETPFALAFGHEAVVPMEIEISTYRTKHFDEKQNNDQIYLNLDLLSEKREVASKRAAKYQQRVTRYYTQNVRVRSSRLEIGCSRRLIRAQGTLTMEYSVPIRKDRTRFYEQQEHERISWLV